MRDARQLQGPKSQMFPRESKFWDLMQNLCRWLRDGRQNDLQPRSMLLLTWTAFDRLWAVCHSEEAGVALRVIERGA